MVTSRHFRRIAYNEYCKTREQLHVNKIQHSYCNTPENILNTPNLNNDADECNNANSVCNFPKLTESVYFNIDIEMYFSHRTKLL